MEKVSSKYPNHSVLGEEESTFNGEEYVWVCDPIDGTGMFQAEVPVCVFSLALVVDGEVIVGVVVDPFLNQTYLATTILGIAIAILLAFLFFNINPAKVFMGDSWAFCLWWLISSTICLINMRIWIWIFIPFIILFLIFIIELWSSWIQMLWKKLFKKKVFPIAPFHHYLEYKWHHEYEITMKFWLIQWILVMIFIILIFCQDW